MISLFRIQYVLAPLLLLWQPAPAQILTPHLLYSDLESGPNTGGQNNAGAYVTIYGKNFGTSQESSFVNVGGGKAVAYPIWTDTKIAFQLGSSAATGNIVVTTPVGTSNGIPFTVRPGKIYFVSPSGSDGNNGSYGSPWKTILHAVQSIKAGDIIYGMNGASQTADDGQGWNAALTLRTAWCGSSGYPRTLAAYPGATVTIGSATGPDSGIRSTDPSADGGACSGYWVFAGLQLRGAGVAATTAGPSSNWRFVGNDMSCPNGDGASACFETGQSSNFAFLGNTVHDTGKLTASAEYQGVYFSTDSIHLNIGWNTIYNVHGCRGLQIHSSPLCSPSCGSSDQTGFNQYDIAIHDNVIHDTQCDGMVLATVDPSKGPVSVYNNVIYNAGKGPNNPEQTGNWACFYASGITNNGAPGGGTVEVFNNTMYNCGSFPNPPYTSAQAGIMNGGSNTALKIRARNNIVYQTNSNAPYWLNASAAPDGVNGFNNLFYGIGAPPASPYITGSISSDPQFASPARFDFHLTSVSVARGKGTNTGILADMEGTPRGGVAGYDLGALQFTPPTVAAITCAPVQIVTPGATNCTVALTVSAPPGGLNVQLASGNGSLVAPSSITVPEGASTATSAVQANPAGAAGTATLTASVAGDQQTFALMLLPAGDSTPILYSTVNAASYLPGPISPGEVVTCFGLNLGPVTAAGAPGTGQGWPTVLGGTQALFDGVAAGLLYVQANQLNAVVPNGIADRASVNLVIEASSGNSAPYTLPVQPSAPGVFVANASGQGQAVVLNEDGSFNSPALPAARGSNIQIFATGLGQTSADLNGNGASNVPGTPLAPLSVSIGGVGADLLQASGLTGIFQIEAQVPPAAPTGVVPLILTAGDAASQGTVTLAVR